MKKSTTIKTLGLFFITLLLAVIAVFVPAIPQDQEYHQFADERSFFGIPNALNVLSNLPFLWVGFLGLRIFQKSSSPVWATGLSKLSYLILFSAIGLTAFGSAFYHWHPNSSTLFWDRLPMSVGFMAFLACIIGERVNRKLGEMLLFPLLGFGFWSIWFWKNGEAHGHGDLRPYALVQFGSLILVSVILLLFRRRYLDTKSIVAAITLYGVAKVFESADYPIYEWLRVISGHTLKHLAAAWASYYLVRAMKKSAPQ